ncbi:unnamed protein product [Pleuronectes platessa]|uniref:Uncharacterized protein n=1 Tax=Pleuronectes platessa TaxID=8262 RepID=A0A9N7VWF4_PLEPL|nr:unnamed protein product [Pleuronectes platessa]
MNSDSRGGGAADRKISAAVTGPNEVGVDHRESAGASGRRRSREESKSSMLTVSFSSPPRLKSQSEQSQRKTRVSSSSEKSQRKTRVSSSSEKSLRKTRVSSQEVKLTGS